MKGLHMLTFILLIVGGLNWLLVVRGWDLATLGVPMGLLKVVYVLVGLSALVELFSHKKCCTMCGAGQNGGMGGGMMK